MRLLRVLAAALGGGVLLLPGAGASTAAATAAPQAMLVPADVVRGFLKSNGVAADGTAKDVKAAMVRVICVRK